MEKDDKFTNAVMRCLIAHRDLLTLPYTVQITESPRDHRQGSPDELGCKLRRIGYINSSHEFLPFQDGLTNIHSLAATVSAAS
jgi:hypothetical protein